MATLVPRALSRVYDHIGPYLSSDRKGGIANAGSPGYHTSREDLLKQKRSADYSIQAPADKRGNAKNAAGIDITLSDAEMKTVSTRLREACTPDSGGEYDPRIECIREFIGTVDGRNVSGYNRYASGSGSRSSTGWKSSGYGDSSHLWHVHVSVFRDRVEDENEMLGLSEVIAGLPAGALGWSASGKSSTPVDPPPPVVKLPTYTVKAGDSLSSIAVRLGVTWQSLASLNKGIDPNRIRVGQILLVPSAVPPVAKPTTPEPKPEPPAVSHTVTGVDANFLRRTDPDDDRKEWPERIGNAIKHILSAKPSYVLGQELDSVTAADVANRLGSVWRYQRLKGIAVFWDSEVFDFTEGRNIEHYFSTKDNRYFLGVPVKHKASGEDVLLSVSHFENDGDTKTDGEAVRRIQATEVAARTKTGRVVFGADLNSTTLASGSNGVKPRVILGKAGLTFLADQKGVNNRTLASHHGGKGSTPKGPWIDDMAWRGFDYVKGGLIRTDATDASDHHFLTVTLKF